jgi:hypothetical protein
MRLNSLAAVATLAIGLVLGLGFGLSGAAMAQDAPPPPGQEGPGVGRGMGFHGVGGQITAINGSTITLRTLRGETAEIKITSSTRFRKDRNEAKLGDFKVGDQVFAAGDQGKDGVWIAQMLGERTGAGGGRGGGMTGGMQVKPEDNGKTYIAGELIKIDGTRLTVKKPDNSEQVIEVDDDTSFRNERRESVTLADMKPGDFVRGQGAVKSGVFVPKVLNAGRTRGRRMDMSAAPPPDGSPQQQVSGAPDSSEKK